jgi:SpoVK/Ycf46/Vps4 family AAA+-type ATPase
MDEKENYDIISNNLDKVKQYIKSRVKWKLKKKMKFKEQKCLY